MMRFFQQRKTAWTKARKAPLEGCGSLAVSPSGEKESPARLSEPRLSHLPPSQHPHHSPTTLPTPTSHSDQPPQHPHHSPTCSPTPTLHPPQPSSGPVGCAGPTKTDRGGRLASHTGPGLGSTLWEPPSRPTYEMASTMASPMRMEQTAWSSR